MSELTQTDRLLELASKPTQEGPHLLFRYMAGVDVKVGRITRDYSRRPQSEVTIEVDGQLRHVYRGTLGLLSRSGIKDAVTTCKRRDPSRPWEDLVDDICEQALKVAKPAIEPIIRGLVKPIRESPRYKLWPLLPSNQPSILFGPGGVGKSWLAILACCLVDNGLSVAGLRGDPGKALYVDYEWGGEDLDDRAFAIKQGIPDVPPHWGLTSISGHGRLQDWADDLAAYVAKEKFDLVVIDSVGMSLGGDAIDSADVIDYFRAIMQIKAAVMLIDHTAKNADGEKTAFGSTYKTTTARSVWEIRRAPGDDLMGLFHRKQNGRPFEPIGISQAIETDADDGYTKVTFTSAPLAGTPGLEDGLTVRQRLNAILGDGALSTETIIVALPDLKPDTITKTLKRYEGKDFIRRKDGTIGLLSKQRPDTSDTVRGQSES